jgi:IS5 family transposase
LLERHQLSEVVLKTVYVHLHNQGFTLRKGTIVDATIIAAPSSTKNEAGERDPEMHSTKKGEQFYFGMKAHIGVDVATGVVHSVEVTAANVADVTVVEECLHGEEEVVFADAGYTGVEKRAEHKGREVCWEIAQKRSRVREGWKAIEQKKASIRAKVEHIFGILKCRFHYVKARYKGLEKNKHQLKVLFALASLVKVRRQWMSRQETCVQN